VTRTITTYRRVVRALATVIVTHWPQINQAKSKCQAVEGFFHVTKQRPRVRYPVLDRMCGTMPSYLRRAAIEAAYGLVSSYLSNQSNWLDDAQRPRGSKPPRLGASNVFPSLYGGNMILIGLDYRSVQIKLLGADGLWRFSAPLRVRGRIKRLSPDKALSPALVQRGAQVSLSCPVALKAPSVIASKHLHRVCAVDVGINTAVTAAVVSSTGTVIARTFLTCDRHNDLRDRLAHRIADKQSQTGRVGPGFCQDLFRRIAGLSLDAARQLSAELIAFARKHGAQALIFERLKGWKPKGQSRVQRKRFHRFQHRMLFKHAGFKAEEMGLKVVEVHAAGTSRWAYDGSGKVVRSPKNAQLATFPTGKCYNADLNAAYNIAARGIAALLNIKKADTGKSSGSAARIPLVLADVWRYATLRQVSLTAAGASDAPTTAAFCAA
jgi:IS605 OrfB family transposase